MKFKSWYGIIIGLVLGISLYLAFSKSYLIGNLVFFILSITFIFAFYITFRNLKINTIKPLKIVLYVFSGIFLFCVIYGLITGRLIILPGMFGYQGGTLSKSEFGSLYFYNNLLMDFISSEMLFYLAYKKNK